MSDSTHRSILAICGTVLLLVLIFRASACSQAIEEAEQKTRQEAIKAGLVEGAYGHWVKDSSK